MRATRLILIEGVPGSGKSTLAQCLARALARAGIAHKWWYEEELGHPVYLFDDAASLRQVLDDLDAGRYPAVIAAALDRWRAFAAACAAADQIVLLDGCLLGYLTWTLFPYDVPPDAIRAYLAAVERIIASLNPVLISLHQRDVAAALRRTCARRGGETEQRLIRNATGSRYGQRRGLAGFAGMVTFWEAYRHLTDTAVAASPMPLLAIENGAGNWPVYQRLALDLLGLPLDRGEAVAPEHLGALVGRYQGVGEAGPIICRVEAEDGQLLADGLPQVWPRTRLIPTEGRSFAVESLPFTVEFVAGADGAVARLVASGPRLLFGAVDCTLERVGADDAGSDASSDTRNA